MPKGTAMPEHGRCWQGPAMSSRHRCRAAAGLWCHLVGCRLPVAPVWRGERAAPARGSPGAAAPPGAPWLQPSSSAGERSTLFCSALQLLLGQFSQYFPLLLLRRGTEPLSFPCWEELVPSGKVFQSGSCHRECLQTLPQGELGVYLHHQADKQISRSPCVPINIREQKHEQVMQHMAKSFILSL